MWNVRRPESSEWSMDVMDEVSGIALPPELLNQGYVCDIDVMCSVIVVGCGNRVRCQWMSSSSNSPFRLLCV